MAEVIRVSIGSEPMQHVAAQCLKASILRRTKRVVEFRESWTQRDGWNPAMKSLPKLKGGTGFNTWRFLTPALYGFKGKAIYLDADQVVLADIEELWESLPEGKTIACVRNAEGVFGKKTPEPNKNQTSVMVIDNTRATWDVHAMASEVEAGRMRYADFMQASWLPLDQVHELDPAWNMFGIASDRTKLIHYSHVGSQPYRNPDHPFAHVFWEALRDALNMRLLNMGDIEHAVRDKHLASVYYKRLERTAM